MKKVFFDICNPETWTRKDRNLLDYLRTLEPEQADFLLDFFGKVM